MVEPCFLFGDLFKGIYQGPTAEPSLGDVAFVPKPVDTNTVTIMFFYFAYISIFSLPQ